MLRCFPFAIETQIQIGGSITKANAQESNNRLEQLFTMKWTTILKK